MQPAEQNKARNGILLLLVAGIALALAGLDYRSKQRAAVTWQDVSGTMQNIESAERELFQSIQAKSRQ